MFKVPSAQNWRKIVSRGKYPILLIWELNQGLLNSHKVTGLKTRMFNYCRLSGGSYICESEAQSVVEEIKKILISRPLVVLTWLDKYYHEINKLTDLVGDINKKLLVKNTEAGLINLYLRYAKQSAVVWRWGYLPFLFDEAIEDEMHRLLVQLKVNNLEIPRTIKILSTSNKLTLHQQEAIQALQLAQKIKKEGLSACTREVTRHYHKWCWKNSWIYNQVDFKKEELKQELLLSAKRYPQDLLKKIQEEKEHQKKAKKHLLNKYHHPRLFVLARILSEYNFWHSHKMEQMTKIIFLTRPLFNNLAQRLSLSYEQFIELTPLEVKNKHFNLRELNWRVKDCGLVMLKGKSHISFGSELIRVKKQIETKPGQSKIIRGLTTFPGKVKGRVVIIPSGSVNLKNFTIKSGDILVTSMTTINMISLVRNAAAIVTDEGGILCHASIISRELGIPCVIGTKIATKVLKNGDLVEIDAEQGIVRKITK